MSNTPGSGGYQYGGKHYGDAGSGVVSSGKFGSSGVAGAVGERHFQKLMQSNSRVRGYTSWASLRIPAPRGSKRYNSDVDFAVASGRRLMLVDIKMWEANRFYWSAFGRVFKGFQVMSESMSRNMEMATNRYREALPGMSVQSMVLFVPTKKGLPSGVALLRWPGGINSYQPQDGIQKIQRFLGEPEFPHQDIISLLGSMTRRGSK